MLTVFHSPSIEGLFFCAVVRR
ncbi:hypothetical protein [Kosakonia sp. BK9b]